MLPNAELAAQAWAAAYSDIPAGQMAGTLPAPEKWTDGAFLQIRALPGGSANIDIPERVSSVLQLDAWGSRTIRDTFRPLWAPAMDLMERIRHATAVQAYGRSLPVPVAGYDPARIFAGYLVSEPVRVERDPSGYARLTVNLALDWTV